MLKTQTKDEEIKHRLREVIKVHGGNASALARLMNLNPAYFVSMLNSPEKGISATVYKALAKVKVNLNWLVNGEGDIGIGIGDESDNSFQSWKDRALTAEKTIKEYERDNENLNFLVKNLERMILEK